MRWLLRVERLLALTSWQLDQDFRRAAAWVGLHRVAGAVTPGREQEQQTGAPGGGRQGRPKPG